MIGKKNFRRYVYLVSIISCVFFCFSSAIAGTPVASQKVLKPKVLKPKVLTPEQQGVKPLRQLYYSRMDWGDVEMSPAVLTIRYGERVLRLNQGTTATIHIDENSDLIDSQGKVPATVEYTLRNKTAKRFRFISRILYDTTVVGSTSVVLYGHKTKTIRKNVKLQFTQTPKYIGISGPVGISDDTPIVFFNARLSVFVHVL